MECGSAKRTRLAAQEAALVKIRAKEKTDKKAADQTKIEALAAANRKRAQEDTDKKAIHQTKIETLAAANRKRAETIADDYSSTLCGAEGCGKGKKGQFEGTSYAAMRMRCGDKHAVLHYAQLFFLVVFTKV